MQSHHVPEDLDPNDIIPYGEGLYVRVIAEQLGLALFEPPYDWLPKLPAAYRLRHIEFTSLSAARLLEKPTFVKPAADKSFDARVYASGAELPTGNHVDDETPTLVAEAVIWEVEYRCFIAHRQVETYAPYMRKSTLLQEDEQWRTEAAEADDALKFIHRFLADQTVEMPPGVVIDIGIIKDRGWAVIEANPAWASGIYGNDPVKVLNVLMNSCVRKENLSSANRTWVIEG